MSAAVAESVVTEVERSWHPDGFRRALVVVEHVTHTIGCAIVLGEGPLAPVTLSVERGTESFSLRMGPDEAGTLGNLLFDAACLALKDPAAQAEALGRTVPIFGARAWIEIGRVCVPLRLALVVSTRPHTFLRLAPEEAIGLGLLLIRANWLEPEADAEAA